MILKSLFAVFSLVIILSANAAEVLPKCKPWQSQGLTPVKVKIDQKVSPLVLSENGKTMMKIVIPAKINRTYYMAIAKLMQKYLKETTGANFQIVKGALKSGKGIFIGPCEDATVKSAFDNIQKKTMETFSAKSFKNGIMLIGNDQAGNTYNKTMRISSVNYSRGTLFAAVDFLERMVGCRFYFPGKLGSCLPDYSKKSLTIPAFAYSDRPVFPFRMGSYRHHGFADNKAAGTTNIKERLYWANLMRIGDVNKQRHGHTDNKWNELFAKSHPEYFALRKDGSRMIGKRAGLSVQRCYTSPGGLQANIDAIADYYKDGKDYTAFAVKSMAPDQKYIRWWPNDGFKGCECPACLKLTDKNSTAPHARLIWYYVAKLADAVKKRWPDKKLLVPAYSSFRTPPKGTRIPENVIIIPVLPAGVSMAYLKEPKCAKAAEKDMQLLGKLNKEKFWMWMHYPHRPRITNRLDTPYPVPHVMLKYIRKHKDKMSGYYLNGHHTTVLALDGIMLYLWYQALWNPAIDPDAMTEEYCKLMFGPASKTMQAYWKLITDRWENTRWKKMPDMENRKDRMGSLIPREFYFGETYPKSIREKLQKMLKKALGEATKDSIYNKRMQWMLTGTEKFFTQGKMFDTGASVRAEAQKMTPVIDGKLDEWEKLPSLSLIDNTNGKAPAAPTWIWTAFDDKNLYIAGKVYEKGGKFKTKGKMSRDMPLWNDDDIEIFICGDLAGLKEAGFPQISQFHQIIINADGSIYDAHKSDGKSNKKVDINFDLKTVKGKDGFVFEMKIPFKSINSIPPKPGDAWPMNFYRTRFVDGKSTAQAWSPTMSSFHDTTKFGSIIFPKPVLWKMPLKLMKSGRHPFMHSFPKNVKTEIKYANNQMIVKCKAPKDLKKDFELKFYGQTETRPNVQNSKTPLICEFEFDIKGTGVFRVRGGVGKARSNTDYIGKAYHTRVAPGSMIDHKIVNRAELTRQKKTINTAETCVFAIKAKPGADFTVTLRKMVIFAK
jgi:Domain of unknown function (DUF4838)/Carbohydrate family 9 binding domain-like